MSAPQRPATPTSTAGSTDQTPRRQSSRGWIGAVSVTAAWLSGASCLWLANQAWRSVSETASAPAWLLIAALGLALGGPVLLIWATLARARQTRLDRNSEHHSRRQRRLALLAMLDLLPTAAAMGGNGESPATPNLAFCHLLGSTDEDARETAIDWRQVVSGDDWPAWASQTSAVMQDGRTRWLRCTLNLDGVRHESLVQIVALRSDDSHELVVVVTLPHGEAGLTQQAIVQLRELLAATEAEKWRFGQAVHDELGQRLSGMAYFAKALQRKLQGAQRSEADDAAWLTDLANESMAVARGIARGLLPVGSEDPGALTLALGELCEWAGRTFDIQCRVDADPRFNPGGAARASHLYHVVQELITNAVKHGKASRVDVELEVLPGHQLITVHNNGRGLSGPPSPGRVAMGLSGVRSRVAYLGGKFMLADDAADGVVAMIELPLAGEVAPDAGAPFNDETP